MGAGRWAGAGLRAGAVALLLAGCGPGVNNGDMPSGSAGQVKPVVVSPMSFYAASRAADQVSFGATPALVAELSAKGLDAWIAAQFALPPTISDAPSYVINYDINNLAASIRGNMYVSEEFFRRAFTAPDQLRQRVAWALFSYIPTAQGQGYGRLSYYNMLIGQAFGNYADLLRAVTIHPMMGFYLNNELNRPPSPECSWCAPNENYARELMQLFTVGVVQLNLDGSTARDAQGKAKETYAQKDVEELARALTGWTHTPSATPLPDSNWENFAYPMVPEQNPALHDRGAKTVMGTVIPAGLDAAQELEAVIALLMKHPNTAPFVSLRLIQHLVTSNPTPEYIARVAAVFRNNGQGVAGDMKAVLRAVLMDAEARRGDQPGADTARIGKIREPIQWFTGVMRGMGCKQPIYGRGNDGNVYLNMPPSQNPDQPPSVFSFYQATDRAPGSNLLAPEQKLLNTQELTNRLGNLNWVFTNSDNPMAASNYANSGCDVAALGKAFAQSPQAFIDLVSTRWFRGAMPVTLRNFLMGLATGQQSWSTPDEGALVLLQFALTSPYYGVQL